MPSFLIVTDGKRHDVRVARESSFPRLPGSIVSIDKAYIDYNWLHSLDTKRVWFVTRAKTNIDYAVTGQHEVTGKGVPFATHHNFRAYSNVRRLKSLFTKSLLQAKE
jgi:hypothetical protein